MKHILPFAALFAVCSLHVQAFPVDSSQQMSDEDLPSHFRVLSPDRMTSLDIRLSEGRLTYTPSYRQLVTTGKQVVVKRKRGKKRKRTITKSKTQEVALLDASPLGIRTNIGDWTENLTIKSFTYDDGNFDKHYRLRQGKQGDIHAKGSFCTLTVANAKGQELMVEFVVENNNIAFRYRIPQSGEAAVAVVSGEATGFDLPAGTSAFTCPQSDAMVGWKRTKPSYEEYYIWDEPATTRSQYGQGWTFPCLFRIPAASPSKGGVSSDLSAAKDHWLLISETGTTGDYCACHLSDATPDGLMTIAFPMEGENNGFGSTGAQMGLSNTKTSPNGGNVGVTPWRTLTFGATLKPIVETTITWDVVEPLYEPSIDYQGSRNTWSWIIWQDPSINYDDQIAYIDLAAALGWEGCLIDGGWYENIERDGMERLFDYCKEKGVRPWVWYNSNGGWNDAPQCARQCMDNPIRRKAELRWLRDHGVAGIKVDFFGGDKQETMRLYEAILSDANDYGIQVIFHGCTLPRGWERMYPNYCGSEAVLASENLVFGQPFCDMEARHACLHPFVRNAVGAMEYGGTVLQKRLNRGNDGGTHRRTSDIFELATAIAFQCSGQNFALTPRNLTEQPQFEIDFMKQVPTTWDETRFIDGYPGKYLVMARRHANRWYIIAMNAEGEAKTITLDNAQLKELNIETLSGAEATLLTDGPDGQTPQQIRVKPDKRGRVQLALQPQCAAIVF